MNNDQLDATIPVLTEIIVPEQDFADAASPPSLSSPPAALNPCADETAESGAVAEVPEGIVSVDVLPPPAMSDSQWEALEQKISERVLTQLRARIDFVLELLVRDSLANALQLAVDGVMAELKHGLHHTLEDGIASAVAEEVAQLRTNHKFEKQPIDD